MPLDSDVENADAKLHAEFYEYEKDPYKGQPFVRIMVPGDKTNIFDQPATDTHKRRFHRQWLHFQMQNSESQIIGTPLMTWHKERPEELTDGQLAELSILKFQSVEQVANASDNQIMRIGMGADGLRQRARSFLTSKNAQANGAELSKAQSEIEDLKTMVARLAAGQVAKPKNKGGRPRKNKVPVNVQHNDAPASAAGGQ